MPLCPQITNTPITVVQNADFTVSSVLPVVAATTTQLSATNAAVEAANAAAVAAAAAAAVAAAAAGVAQADAAAALAEATTAYNTAIGSLQPSANTIVNASNQITGINGNGITVYSGSSATTGARVVLNSTGLAGFGSINITNVVPNGSTVTYTAGGHSFRVSQSVTISGLAPAGYNGTFTIISIVAGSTFTVINSTTATVTDANGIADFATIAISASTGTVNVSGGIITSSTITGGSLNIAGNAIIDANGLLTATGATITGTINAGSGYFGTPSNGFSISSTGLVGVGAGTIVGGTIQGSTFLTSTGSSAVILNGPSNAIQFKSGGNVLANMVPLGVGGLLMHYGTTPEPSGGAFPQIFIGSANISMSVRIPGAGLNTIAVSEDFITLNGTVTASGIVNSSTGSISAGSTSGTATAQVAGAFLGASGPVIARRDNAIPFFAHKFNASGTTEMLRFIYNGNDAGGVQTTAAGVPSLRSASDYRLKSGITDFVGAAEIIKNVRLRTYRYNVEPDKDAVGFVAHELAAVLPSLVIGEKDAIDEEGQPVYQSVATTDLIPYLTGALKDVIKRLEILEGE